MLKVRREKVHATRLCGMNGWMVGSLCASVCVCASFFSIGRVRENLFSGGAYRGFSLSLSYFLLARISLQSCSEYHVE